jgi:exopolysaccharide biosynthesis protein
MKRKNAQMNSDFAADVPNAKPVKKKSGLLGRIIRRFFLLVFTIVILAVVALCLVLNLVFNGPSESARKLLVMSLTEASATKWVPGLFLDDEIVAEIRENVEVVEMDEFSDTSEVVIDLSNAVTGNSDEWADYPDGIRIEHFSGRTYDAHVMIVRDPSRVYMATSTEKFSYSIPGTRITQEIENEQAVAAINAGAFFDNGTAGPEVGSVPLGLVYAGGKCVWTQGVPNERGFAGFNEDNILVVAKDLTQAQAEELNIRDGCGFGPVLIMNGEINQEAYSSSSGLNPRTVIGQRKDGAVIFLCVDGRQAGSLGATYADLIDIMLEYGAYNACNMDGGSSSVMLYRNIDGQLDCEVGTVGFVNNQSPLQAEPRRMPNFWMVRPVS